ncbi:MAG: hypothetical protein DYH16_08215 [Nitrosomonas sp. PRO5]|nr:hypothetical protein [Nitrosomonas sp. PRO5]
MVSQGIQNPCLCGTAQTVQNKIMYYLFNKNIAKKNHLHYYSYKLQQAYKMFNNVPVLASIAAGVTI